MSYSVLWKYQVVITLTDGQSEHFHYFVEQILYCYVTSSYSNWVVALASAAFALNLTVSVAHRKSPFVGLFGKEPTLPLDLAMTTLSNCIVQAVSDFISSQEKSFSDIHIVLAKTNESMAYSANKQRHDVQFHSGDLVYANTAHFFLASGLSKKLAPKWVRPFPIEWVISSVAYCISLPEEYGQIHPVFHVSPLHRHHGPPPSCPTPIILVADSSQPEYEVEDSLAQ